MATGITNIFNNAPELPLQYIEDFLSTPQFNLINSFGADLHYAEAHIGQNIRMSWWQPLSTDGGQLDGSGIDPAPEIPVRIDVDAKSEVFGKAITVTEQVTLYENDKVMTKYMALGGQWMREKEDLLMRDLYASSPTYLNCIGGTNGDQPSNISRPDVNNIEKILLGNDARTMLEVNEADLKIGTGPTRDAFIALCSTDLSSDLQSVDGVQLKNTYPQQAGLRPEEYCAISRFRFFVSSKGIKVPNSSMLGADVYKIPMYGVEAVSKIEQNGYTARAGFRPDWVVSNVAQNSQLYFKFAMARAVNKQQWLSGLNATVRL